MTTIHNLFCVEQFCLERVELLDGVCFGGQFVGGKRVGRGAPLIWLNPGGRSDLYQGLAASLPA
jgi:hypothetical protein